ncbi:T9SS type A sorting domain-containing protein [Brumimicrobium aurantiacum]|uniref:T9SS C-terminal target domain-containing protein n=1 Tax=Brumimicrobium aurantiacum TaxID=1737063 RepID=A0A3E1F1Z5_9FLAO|nr:T9SS type A sorting domain-containing protein [Brumimicrobium aurantiacum]RFC55851.1 T9SS C-terminal target domain-containing protein [Brumimicrobium aurantiacum]
MRRLLFTLFLVLVFVPHSIGQYHFTTSFKVQGNKTVVIELVTTGIRINQQNSEGYNFDVEFDYSIKAYNKNGKENSYSFWTMQGYFYCDGREAYFPLSNSTGSGSGVSSGNMWSDFSDPNSASVEDLMCNTLKFEIGGQGYKGGQFVYVTGNSTLPIELISFDANTVNQQVDLNWSTASELNNDYFTIERSNDGMNWETVQTIEGAGNSSRVLNYTWTDYSPYGGISYYRLTQTDFDGAFETFDVLSVVNNELTKLQASPNPTSGLTTLTGLNQNTELHICNSMGVEVSSKVNISRNGGHTVLDMSYLPRGIYFARSGDQSLKIVKQ